jgi:exopolysaccharide production protein ExoQ
VYLLQEEGQSVMKGAMPRWWYLISSFFVLDTMQAFGFIDSMLYPRWDGKGGDYITQTLNLLMIAASLILLGVSLRRNKRGFATGSLLALSAVGFLCLSTLWSLNPAGSFRDGVVYLFVIIGVIGIARTMDADEFMRLLSWCCFLSAIASIVLTVASPHVAFVAGDNEGTLNFNGIFPHKNFLGQVMATGALATLHGIRIAKRRYLGKLCMLLVFVGMTYASKSTGALLAAFLFCGISGIDSLLRMGGVARLSGFALAIALVPTLIVAVAAPDTFLELIGKDPTLTGRTEIWDYVIRDIWMKPWLGWGYFGFWQLTNPAALEISNTVHWIVPNAHNGLLEFLLNVGALGTALFVFILIRILFLAIQCLRIERALAISTISCCLGILLVGLSETVLLEATQSSTTVMFITGLMCERALYLAKGLRRYRIVDRQGQVSRRLPSSTTPLSAHG